eukprot:5706471-Pyramimonas_sp.AAC.1
MYGYYIASLSNLIPCARCSNAGWCRHGERVARSAMLNELAQRAMANVDMVESSTARDMQRNAGLTSSVAGVSVQLFPLGASREMNRPASPRALPPIGARCPGASSRPKR